MLTDEHLRVKGSAGSIIAIGFAVDHGEPHVVTADTEVGVIEGFDMMLRAEVETLHGSGGKMAEPAAPAGAAASAP